MKQIKTVHTEALTDELLEHLSEMYQTYKQSMELLDESYVDFDYYVQLILKFREHQRRKGMIKLVK